MQSLLKQLRQGLFMVKSAQWLALLALPCMALPAHAALTNFYTATGKLGLSVDGCGTLSVSCDVRVNKPSATATVRAAFLLSASTGGTGYQIPDGLMTLAGQPVNWDVVVASSVVNNYNQRADVTTFVRTALSAAPAGITTMTVGEGTATASIDGSVLVVVFDDPAQTSNTSVLLNFGAMNPSGDEFKITLASPIDPAAANAQFDMGLGISYSYQSGGINQASTVTVNGQLLTSAAGGEDDGEGGDGALITVGGTGDSNADPADPTALPSVALGARSDDELYSLLPFITASTTDIDVTTQNPSLNDNIFFAYFRTSAPAKVTGSPDIVLSETATSHPVGSSHTVQAVVTDGSGTRLASTLVTFTVTSGPNQGDTFTVLTDASGLATFTYASSAVGDDTISASITVSGSTVDSNSVSVNWLAAGSNTSAVPTLNETALALLALLLAGAVAVTARRRA